MNDDGHSGYCCGLCHKREAYASDGRCYDTETFGSCDGCLVCDRKKDDDEDDPTLVRSSWREDFHSDG